MHIVDPGRWESIRGYLPCVLNPVMEGPLVDVAHSIGAIGDIHANPPILAGVGGHVDLGAGPVGIKLNHLVGGVRSATGGVVGHETNGMRTRRGEVVG